MDKSVISGEDSQLWIHWKVILLFYYTHHELW